jgi:hypothetical protein
MPDFLNRYKRRSAVFLHERPGFAENGEIYGLLAGGEEKLNCAGSSYRGKGPIKKGALSGALPVAIARASP